MTHRGAGASSGSPPHRTAALVSRSLKKANAGIVTPTLSAAASVSAVLPRNQPPCELTDFTAAMKL